MSIYKDKVFFPNKVFFLREEYGNGQGTFIYPNGRYSGEWKGGEYHGQGTLSFDDGVEYVGIFKESKPWNIIVFDSKQNIIGMWLNGLEE